ncbi:MAG TPA: hypothetical protein DCG75_02015 [Bacteroidales bacterium]|nr:hypothetical protein [Bacteroidales bacterium]
MPYSVSKELIIDFILNDIDENQRIKITESINTNTLTKELYLSEKRKYDVERYLDDEMGIGERCEIEELLKINESLYEHFELSKDVNEFLKIEAFNEQLNTIHAELFNSKINQQKFGHKVSSERHIVPVKKLKYKVLGIGKWVAAASIILFVATFGMTYFTTNQNSLEERLYDSYYEPFQNNTNSFFNSSSLIEAKKKYNNQEYDIAWLLIENLPNSMTIEAEKTLYAGLTLMELERYTEAINKFKFLQTDEDQTVINSINQWYLALCYLKTERRTDAKDILEKIVANKSYNHSEARKILKKLN